MDTMENLILALESSETLRGVGVVMQGYNAAEKYELVKDKHGFVLAGMEGVRYREYELQLSPGDELYVYTDGVAEATNGDHKYL